MKQRLVRALQRGGVTAEIRPDIWGVWRGRDRRRRMIGELPGREIDLLKLNAHLTPVGDPYHVVMTWNQTAGRRAPFKIEPSAPRGFFARRTDASSGLFSNHGQISLSLRESDETPGIHSPRVFRP